METRPALLLEASVSSHRVLLASYLLISREEEAEGMIGCFEAEVAGVAASQTHCRRLCLNSWHSWE